MQDWHKWEIKQVEISDKKFPKLLRKIKPVVEKLFYRGEWDEKIFEKTVAVVGSRRMTRYGEVMTERLAGGLAEIGYTIVSGFMYGVDTMAHKVCVQNKGRTVAVLGSGLDCLTPAENDNLYTKILENDGLMVSEFEPKQEAKLWTFPYRNRIVSGLSQAVLVIEAGEKSGSLVTARWAFKQKKKVLAVPGAATASLSVGTNWLIKNGAVLVSSVNDILEELGENRQGRTLTVKLNLAEEEERIVELLKNEEMSVDEISRKLNKDVAAVGRLLSEMSLKGLVEEFNGKYMIGF